MHTISSTSPCAQLSDGNSFILQHPPPLYLTIKTSFWNKAIVHHSKCRLAGIRLGMVLFPPWVLGFSSSTDSNPMPLGKACHCMLIGCPWRRCSHCSHVWCAVMIIWTGCKTGVCGYIHQCLCMEMLESVCGGAGVCVWRYWGLCVEMHLCCIDWDYQMDIISSCALSLYATGIPPAEPKTEPEIYFFDVVSQANTLFHLFEKQFTDSFIPLVM